MYKIAVGILTWHLATQLAQPNTFVGSGNGEIDTVLKDHAKTKTFVNQEKNTMNNQVENFKL